MQPLARVLVLTIGLVLLGTPASAVVLSPGDIVVLTTSFDPSNNPEVVAVDPSTGAGEVIANASTCPLLSDGFRVGGPAVEASGNLVIAVNDAGSGAVLVVRIDPADGSCSIVSGPGVGGTHFGSNFHGIAAIPAAPLVGASAISDWGIALVVGILLGLSFRLGRRSATTMA